MRALEKREKLLLGGLALAAVGWYYFGSGSALGLGAPPRVPRAESAAWGEPPVVRMDLLASQKVDYDPEGRNLFQYYIPRPPVQPPPPRIERPAPPVVQAPPPPPPPEPPRAPPRPVAPVPSFQYVGVFGPKDGKIAAFDDGGRIVLARVGDVVQHDFKLIEFKYETVILGYVDERFAGQTAELKFSAPKAR